MNDRAAILGYRIVRPLATGGMGAVFEVEKLATRQRFAAKFLHEHLATEREYRVRFEREVGALCAVRHPHIVNIFGSHLPALGQGGKPYILMELLHGEGLDQLLAREVALAPRRAIGIMLQALDGLVAAHSAGVIHRDLGPSNVFLTLQPQADPLVKLLDFGLAGPVGGGEAQANVTQAGTVMGKPAYVAPEMFEGRPIDSRSDIFACGVLLFRMIAGRLPYREQDSSLLWIERYAERREPREYPALRDILANVPECLDEACARAMRRAPEQRFRNAREMQLALLDADTELARRVVGQTEAITAVANAVRRARAGLQDPNRPLGSFIFLGPTGVGKTELARSLAYFLFDTEKAMIRIDMSEFMEKHSVARLIGAPPGYVGYEEGGYLTEAVRRRPYSVILFDEIEKAHPDVFNVLLQILDDGRMTDGKGRTVDFKNTILIMTSNLGSQMIMEMGESRRAEMQTQIDAILHAQFRPEFLNRIDEIIIFHSLGREHLARIIDIQVELLTRRLAEQKYSVSLTEPAKEYLIEVGYDPSFGARPLKRAIQRYVQDGLAMKILDGTFAEGDTIVVDRGEAGLTFGRG